MRFLSCASFFRSAAAASSTAAALGEEGEGVGARRRRRRRRRREKTLVAPLREWRGERPEGEGASLSPVRTPQEREGEEEEEEGVYCLAPKRREALIDGTLLPLPLLVVAKRENPLPPPPFLCAKKRVPELGLLSLRLLRRRPPPHSAAEVASPSTSTHTRSLGRDTSVRGAGSFLSSLLSLKSQRRLA